MPDEIWSPPVGQGEPLASLYKTCEHSPTDRRWLVSADRGTSRPTTVVVCCQICLSTLGTPEPWAGQEIWGKVMVNA